MGALLARFRIGWQIAVLGTIGLLGVLLVAGINQWGTAQGNRHLGAAAAAREASQLSETLQRAMLQGRLAETEFLLRRQETSLARHAQAMAAADAAIGALAGRVAGQPQVRAEVAQVGADLGRYECAVGVLAQAARRVGLSENGGLQGALRASVHAVEATLKTVDAPRAQIAMLMMRRHEKDFIARLDPKYATELKARLPEFAAALDAVALAPAAKAQVMAEMAAYQASFAGFVTATLAQLDAERQVAKIDAEIEPRLAALGARLAARADAELAAGVAAAAAAHRAVLLSVAAIALAVAALAWRIGRGIARPIVAVTGAMQALVRGELATPLPATGRRDEIGTMVLALHAFRDSLSEAARLRAAQDAARDRAEAEKRQALRAMAEQIESGAGESVQAIGQRTTEMIALAEQMGALAGESGAAARGAADAAGLALDNAQTVADAAERLADSIRDIGGRIGQSTTVVGQAVADGAQAGATINALNERVGRIGSVAEIIADIAAKTNLLALNATIEAARAGAAGRGFAVVAAEVKQLAQQTSRSTGEIGRHLAEVRAATAGAVQAVDRIGTRIGEIDAIAAAIAAAVAEQGTATTAIAGSVAQTAAAVQAMVGMNAALAHAAEQTGGHAGAVLGNTRSLDTAVVDLKQTMIRIVRTSADEVDRRASPRHAASLTCAVTLDGQPGVLAATLVDISAGGARLTGLHGATRGARGTLRLDELADALPFVILQADAGAANIAFPPDTVGLPAITGFLARRWPAAS